ncbi:MAG: NADH pyrophosphatase, partial [Solirubrobacteraceae bacterium]
MSGANAFTGARLDRAGDERRRDDAWLAARFGDPRARAVLAGDAGVVMEGERLAIVPLAEAGPDHGGPYLLGDTGDGPLFAVDVD